MARAGYYEKKITLLEKELEQLKEQKKQLECQQRGVEKISMDPFMLQKLIREQEHKNQELLKSRR